MNKIKVLLALIVFTHITFAQKLPLKDDFAHTYSIVAYDENTGEMGVAVQSHWFAVGKVVPWTMTNAGVVATQSFANTDYGTQGLELMQQMGAQEALDMIRIKDEGEAFRQVAFISASGEVAAFTGDKCIAYAGHYVGKHFSVQANMMATDKVIDAMRNAYESNAQLPLAERMLKALEAAQNEGGDIRGMQSAALVVIDAKSAEPKHPSERKIDLRVDDNKQPLVELKRLLQVHNAYEFMNKADVAIEKGNFTEAIKLYEKAEQLIPDQIEISYWKAISTINTGKRKEGLQMLKKVLKDRINWKYLTYRLQENGMIELTKDELYEVERM